MAAKIQDGRHILKFSEYLGISAVVIPRIVIKHQFIILQINLYSGLWSRLCKSKMAAKIQDGRHLFSFFKILKFFSFILYRSVWNSTTLLYYKFLYFQASDPGCANPRWLPKSKMAAILKFSECNSFQLLSSLQNSMK